MGKLAVNSMLAITAMTWLAQPAVADADAVSDEKLDILEYVQPLGDEETPQDSAVAAARAAIERHYEDGNESNNEDR